MRKKILPLNDLKKELVLHRDKGEKIVFTNGCFDLLHIGHVRYLREARKLGDVLIVAINSDTSVKRIKPKRPVMPEDQRAEILSALEMVDYVTFFSEDTPLKLIGELEPHVLVKGGDWKKEDIVGADCVPHVYSLPYVEGVSTTEIIRRIAATEQS